GGYRLAANEGTALPSESTVASFKDPTGSGYLSNYSATIDWGDDSTSMGDMFFNADTDTFQVGGTHTYDDGSFTITVTIHKATAPDGVVTDQAKINHVPSLTANTIQAIAGGTFTGVVGFFTDSSSPASDFTGIVDWQDGQQTAGSVVPFGSGFNIVATHSFAAEGSHNFTITLLDQDGTTDTATASINIADAPLTAFPK